MPGTKRSGGNGAKTVAELKRDGTYRADRHAGIENPEPPEGEPVPPKPLEGDAAEEWARMVESLKACKTVTAVDAHALYQYCQMFAETEAIAVAKLEVAASIDILEDNLGDIAKDQLVQVFQEITKLRQLESRCISQLQSGRMKIRAYLVEFGLTPAARGRVKVTHGKTQHAPVSPLERLQAQQRSLRAV